MLDILQYHTILYVEDEPEIQSNIGEYLKSYFADVYFASDGIEAMKQYRRLSPDVLLLDISIPGMDGLTFARKIREENDRIKIIILTAHTETQKLLDATELRLTKYLIKPVTPRFFKETMSLLAEELRIDSSYVVEIVHDCFWNEKLNELHVSGKSVSLTPKEERLLKLFIQQKGKTVSYADIMLAVWDDALERDISIDSVKNRVSQLRKKLPQGCIHSVYGIGYTLK